MTIFIPKLGDRARHYDIQKTYEWNYANAPALPDHYVCQPSDRDWMLCGVEVNSPVAIAAGPLLNGRWVLHYAAMGFDLLTYKTVRSKSWPCYSLPNLQPVEWNENSNEPHRSTATMQGSWAVSFGMPSSSPDLWRFDVEETRRLLPKQKKLSVSVVASPEPDWTIAELAEDYAKCAYWAKESGADFVELNFSCPNISTQCAQLYLDCASAKVITDCVRQRVGDIPVLIKVGHVPAEITGQLILALDNANAVVMINCLGGRVRQQGELLFDGQVRGIAGTAIHAAVRDQVARFVTAIKEAASHLEIVAVGGISNAEDVEACLSLGAQGIQMATRAMVRS